MISVLDTAENVVGKGEIVGNLSFSGSKGGIAGEWVLTPDHTIPTFNDPEEGGF